MAWGISIPRPGIEPGPPAVGAQSPNHWTTREVPYGIFLCSRHCWALSESQAHLLFSTVHWRSASSCTHFTDEETEALGDETRCLVPHSSKAAELRLEPSVLLHPIAIPISCLGKEMFFKKKGIHLKWKCGTSLVAQWLRIRLPMQGTRVRALVREDPTCCRATKPVQHNYWACTLEPASHNYWACVPQLLKPQLLEPMLCNKSSHCNENPVHCNEE